MPIRFEDQPPALGYEDTLIEANVARCQSDHEAQIDHLRTLHPDMRAARAFLARFGGRFNVRISINYQWYSNRGVTIQVHDMTSAEPIVKFLRFLAREGFPKTGKPADEGQMGKRTWRLQRPGEKPNGAMWLAVFFPVDNDGGSTDLCRMVRREKVHANPDADYGHRYELVCPDGSMPSGPIGPVVMEGGGGGDES